MSRFDRTDRSILGRWWWTVDHWTMLAVIILISFGVVLALAVSPATGARIGVDGFYLAKHQVSILPLAFALVFVISLLTPRQICYLGCVIFFIALILTFSTLIIGAEIKGAKRWLNILGNSIQPSEFLKPSLAIITSYLLTKQNHKGLESGWMTHHIISVTFYGLILFILLCQPDLGMSFVISVIWFSQIFLAGLPLRWAGILGGLGIVLLFVSYLTFPHVTVRINGFLNPGSADTYQVDRSLEAFSVGGLYGLGPGEGIIKKHLPDAHADFIFAVAGEELGLLACLLIVGIFFFIMLKSISRLLKENNLFVLLAGTGLVVNFILQAIINMASALHLIPTKGMTLPFISYGGSSLLATSLGMGMLLALTRRRASSGAI
ncbi:MAG: putative lipid II flippase FtsW [Alphaproteobacteria bacterium]|nr:putative lipid II flippase FtsW [Alphaproteobacteria bacterium]